MTGERTQQSSCLATFHFNTDPENIEYSSDDAVEEAIWKKNSSNRLENRLATVHVCIPIPFSRSSHRSMCKMHLGRSQHAKACNAIRQAAIYHHWHFHSIRCEIFCSHFPSTNHFFSFFCFLSATRPDHQHQPSNTNALIYSNRRTISAQFKYTNGMLLVVNSKRFQYQYRQRKETQNQYR